MGMEMKLKFNNVCQACGRTRRKAELLYDTVDLKPFCARMDECNDQHPNSYAEVMEREGVTIEMVPFNKAADIYYDRMLESAPPLQKRVMKLLETPTSLRVGDEHLAQYLIKLQDAKGYESMTKTINEIIKDHRERYGDPAAPVESKPAVIGTHPAPSKPNSPAPPVTPAPVFTPPVKPAEAKADDDDMTF